MQRVAVAAADACREKFGSTGGRRGLVLMVTFTYRDDVEWSPKQISECMRAISRRARRQGFDLEYQWVIELTQRGRPHYHALLWVPYGFFLSEPDRNGDWPHGSTRVERARRAVGYLVKYVSKGEGGGVIPPGARLFCVSRVDPRVRLAARRAGLPVWLLRELSGEATGRRVAFVGWVASDTGEIFESPWTVSLRRMPDGTLALVLTLTEKERCH